MSKGLETTEIVLKLNYWTKSCDRIKYNFVKYKSDSRGQLQFPNHIDFVHRCFTEPNS